MARNKPRKQSNKKTPTKLVDIELDFVKDAIPQKKDVGLEVVNPEMMSGTKVSVPSARLTEEKKFDHNAGFYIEIHRGNIFHYFSSALVAPSKYFERRAFEDVQSRYNDFLILANGTSVALDENVVLLEIELLAEEMNALEVVGSIAYLSSALPITRVKKIVAINEKVKKSIISDALLFNGGFIPEKLFSITSVEKSYDLKFIQAPQKVIEDISVKIKHFNHVLGLFAFLRSYTLLVADKTSTYKTLPDHFFYAMQALDSNFGSQIVPKTLIHEFYSFLFNENTPSDKQLLKWIFDRIKADDNFHDDDVKEFQKVFSSLKDENMQAEQVKTIFSSLRQSLERKSILSTIELSKSKSALPLYTFAFLRNYANLSSIEVARRDIPNVYSSLYGEYAFSLLGYFYGYASLKNNDERLLLANPAIAYFKLAEKKPAIKFQLESAFDHAIINQVYHKVFGGQVPEIENVDGKLLSDSHQTLPGDAFEIAMQSFGLIDIDYKRILVKPILRPEPQVDKASLPDLTTELSRTPERISYHSELAVLCRRLGMKAVIVNDPMTNLLQMNLTEIMQSSFYQKSELLSRLKDKRSGVSEQEVRLRLQLAIIVGEL
ncbi:hypothetical protein [Pedobacter hiemivivus]|uniref:Uncharacterized protein n=1 Tax=Pedobacter hiemivivus TaxID=2530454 RepID=A0A4R0NG76_9SPHI|nr:hypothetical protein [Pedobacter hiemivivus]TCC99168.1 hypothetical protein EZ444_00340 [Pedobacter hiemivivus]